MLLRQTLTFRYDKMVPIDLQLSSKPEDTTGVIMEIVKVQDEESIVDELYAIYEDDLLIDEWICTFFVKRLQDGLYLSVDPNRKHVYWSENKGLKQVFRINEDNGPLFSYLVRHCPFRQEPDPLAGGRRLNRVLYAALCGEFSVQRKV